MKWKIALLICIMQISANCQPKHQLWNDVLTSFVDDEGNVNYKALQKDASALRNYLSALTVEQPNSTWSESEIKAYWINAYNAYTLKLIIDHYPLNSIKDLNKPWDINLIPYEESLTSLNFIEHEILRKMNDPRIHFAIVCASTSCPKLQNSAFIASTLDKQLNTCTREFLSDTSKNDLSEETLELSKIFKWFRKDFEINGSLIAFISNYTDIKIRPDARIKYKNYNWDLNE